MESVFITKTPNLWSKICVLFLCGRWARHCYITSLLTLHWSRPIQVANNRPIYVVGCTWSSNTCKVLYFWFGGQNDLLRTMWYFIIQFTLHLYNILGLVSGKFEISRLYIYCILVILPTNWFILLSISETTFKNLHRVHIYREYTKKHWHFF